MLEFNVGEHRYRARKMNARQQFHVARRLGPLFNQLLQLGPAIANLTPGTMGDAEANKVFEEALGAFTSALAKIPDQDCDYVLDRCMEVSQRLQGGNGSGQSVWADVWNSRLGRMMFEDIDVAEMFNIAGEVLRDNLSGFFSIMPGPSPNGADTEPSHQAIPASVQ
jgi:hypothetical protein